MEFQALLTAHGIALREVALCLHKPSTPRVRAALAVLAETAPELFDAYQSTHTATPEATLKSRPIMASFLNRGEGEQVFLGLFRRIGWTDRLGEDLDADPRFQAMHTHLMTPCSYADEARRRGIPGRAQFDLQQMAELGDLMGRLIVRDPGTRTFMRLAETTPLPIIEITRIPDLAPTMPPWWELAIDTPRLRTLPIRWAEQLRNWRGIYLITDEHDGARYVGAAYGEENLHGRWRAHIAREVRVTRKLALRNPETFRFSILELLSPAATIEVVTQAEQGWMLRLHTREFGLNA